jgi:hypothetical protein
MLVFRRVSTFHICDAKGLWQWSAEMLEVFQDWEVGTNIGNERDFVCLGGDLIVNTHRSLQFKTS